jgi:Ca2+-binding RTX toxin-like protein
MFGTSGTDHLTGNGGADILIGRGGGDELNGGDGQDTVSYAGSPAGVTVNLDSAILNGGDAQGDTITGVENITGSSHGDHLTGNSLANLLSGGEGDDFLTGGAGADIFAFSANGGEGSDTITDFNATEDSLLFSAVLDNDGDLNADISDLLDPAAPQHVDFSKSLDNLTIELTVHGANPEPTTITLHAADGTNFSSIESLTDLNVQVDHNSPTI